MNSPNPVTDVHTTTFAVKGAGAAFVSALKVRIYNLAGRLVYEDEVAGTSLAWHTDSDYGEYLANGVYLYKLYALVNGEWVASGTKRNSRSSDKRSLYGPGALAPGPFSFGFVASDYHVRRWLVLSLTM